MASKHRPLLSAAEQVHYLRFIPSDCRRRVNLAAIVHMEVQACTRQCEFKARHQSVRLNRKNDVLNLIEKLYPSLEHRIRQRYGI